MNGSRAGFPAGRLDESASDFVERLGRKSLRKRDYWLVWMRTAVYKVWNGPCGPRAEILDVYCDSDEQECAFFDVEIPRLDAAILLLTIRIALADAAVNETPVLTVNVRRDVREFGPKRTRWVGPVLRSHPVTYRNEQTRFAFAPTFVDETLEVAIIDETHGQFRLELASEQHLWDTYDPWDDTSPAPTDVAVSDEDGSELTGCGVYTVQGVAR